MFCSATAENVYSNVFNFVEEMLLRKYFAQQIKISVLSLLLQVELG